ARPRRRRPVGKSPGRPGGARPPRRRPRSRPDGAGRGRDRARYQPPVARRSGGAHGNRSPPMRRLLAAVFYACARWACGLFLIFLFSARSVGSGHIPRRGPVLLIANHESFIDPILVGVGIGRHVSFLARKTLFKSAFKRLILESLNAVPIDQEGVGKEG